MGDHSKCYIAYNYMKSLIFKTPQTICAFHESNFISHFCRYYECLLPLCRDCLPIHRKEHNAKQSPIDLISIEQQGYSLHRAISKQLLALDQTFAEILDNINSSNQLHANLKASISTEKETLMHAISLYYESLIREIDLNYQRRHMWMQDITNFYHSVREELLTIQERLQGEKHLRTIIMWNRLHPEDHIAQIQRQSKKQIEPPSFIACDIQKVISLMSNSQSMVVLDLQGDMGFSQLAKVLYTLRFGPEQSMISNSNITNRAGISLISRGSLGKGPSTTQKLILSKSTDKL